MPPARRREFVLAAAALPLLAAAGASGRAATGSPVATVAIENFTFTPPLVTVPAGAAVAWVNRDDTPHTATAEGKAFGSPVLDTDDSFTFRFDRPGSYRYFCKLHPRMSGTVEVTPGPG